MRYLPFIAVLAFATAAQAQPELSDTTMREAYGNLDVCLSKNEWRAKADTIQEKMDAIDAEITRLCKTDKQAAIAYTRKTLKELDHDPIFAQLDSCTRALSAQLKRSYDGIDAETICEDDE